MPAISFSQATYSVEENEQILVVSIVRSGDTESFVIVLVANHPYEGTATGKCFIHCGSISFLISSFPSLSHSLTLSLSSEWTSFSPSIVIVHSLLLLNPHAM